MAYTAEQLEQFDDIGVFLQDCCNKEEAPTESDDWGNKTAVSDFVATLNWW